MASGDDSWGGPGARAGKSRHLRGVSGDPEAGAVVLSFSDAQQRRAPKPPPEDAVTAPNGWPAIGRSDSRRRLSVVGEDGAGDEPEQPATDDDGPDIA